LACVVYAAKSSLDPRGSRGTQAADCLTAIDALGGRTVVALFEDEAVLDRPGFVGDGLFV
jgi:hypothetical protein